jgi:ribonucleotide monophosphatase NagD (HAD superfamily)
MQIFRKMEIGGKLIDTIFTDCDGVLWENETAIEGSFEALRRLQSAGVRVFFCSNNSSKTRSEYVDKFGKLGLETTKD